jgi:hypothetical protein
VVNASAHPTISNHFIFLTPYLQSRNVYCELGDRAICKQMALKRNLRTCATTVIFLVKAVAAFPLLFWPVYPPAKIEEKWQFFFG